VALRAYQIAAAKALAHGTHVGLWMAAGLGKTATALHAWDLLGRPTPILVVTRAIGRHVWPRDAQWLLGDSSFSILWGGKARSKSGIHRDGTYSDFARAFLKKQAIVTNYEVLGKRIDELKRIPWRVVIYDEAHALKMGYMGLKQRKDGTWQTNQFTFARDIARGVHNRKGHVWQITATPIRDRVRDYWGQLNIALPGLFPARGKREWLLKYCNAYINRWGGWDTTGAQNLDELADLVLQYFIALDRESVREQLPAIQRDIRVVDAGRSPQRAFKHYEDAIAYAASTKHDDAVSLALEYMSSGAKAVIVTTRRKLAADIHGLMLKSLSAKNHGLRYDLRTKVTIQAVTGETPIKQRMHIVNEFNSSENPGTLVATLDSISESINLHLVDGLIVAGLPYTPAQVVQMEGRVGRLGGKPCTIHYLVAKDTIDEQIRYVLLDKLDAVTEAGSDTQGGHGAAESLRVIRNEEDVISSLKLWLEKGARNDG